MLLPCTEALWAVVPGTAAAALAPVRWRLSPGPGGRPRPASGSRWSLSSQLQPSCMSPAARQGSGGPSREAGAVPGPPFPASAPGPPARSESEGGAGDGCRDRAPGTRALLPRLCWVAWLCPLLAPSCIAATGAAWMGSVWTGQGWTRGVWMELVGLCSLSLAGVPPRSVIVRDS